MTAEFAACVPAVLLLLLLCLSAMQVSGTQVRLQDAAAGAARIAARGGGDTDAAGRVQRLLPGASLAEVSRGDLICVRLTAPGRLAGGVLGTVMLSASSCSPDATP